MFFRCVIITNTSILSSEADHINVESLERSSYFSVTKVTSGLFLPRSAIAKKEARFKRCLLFSHALADDMFIKTLLDVGVFNSDGEMWKYVRFQDALWV